MIISGDNDDWSDSGYILKEEQIGFADGGYKLERGVNGYSRVSGLGN